MPNSHQPYSDRNFEFWEIHDLLTESYAQTGRVNMWSFCRFENWRYRIHSTQQRRNVRYLTKLARLWRGEKGYLLGLALSEDDMDDIHVIVRPGRKDVEREIYTWINTELAQRNPRVETFTDTEDHERRQLLADMGYRCQGELEYLRHFDLRSPKLPEFDNTIETGWRVQDVLVDRNLEERARVIGSAFRANFVLDQDYLLKWDATRQAPGYRPYLELAAVRDQSEYGAVCFGWVDLKNHVGEIEPVGTHPHVRRRGLASAVIHECFNRMRAMGLVTAFIASGAEPNPSNRLYETLQPAQKQVFERWVKVYR
jgi:ribosomal protein S18 acetylase RimI-like enzyme